MSIPRPLPWLLAGFAWLLAILAIRSFLVFLREADELLRRIQTERDQPASAIRHRCYAGQRCIRDAAKTSPWRLAHPRRQGER